MQEILSHQRRWTVSDNFRTRFSDILSVFCHDSVFFGLPNDLPVTALVEASEEGKAAFGKVQLHGCTADAGDEAASLPS